MNRVPEMSSDVSRRSHVLGMAFVVAVATLAVFAPVRHHAFIHFDDPLWLTDNETVQQGLSQAGVRYAFETTDDGNWVPLTWLSHMVVVELFGMSPAAHLLTNAAIHALSAALLLLALCRMTGALWPSALVAALFALHPLRVESVAWASERKDVLSGLFLILTLFAYAFYAERQNAARYIWVLVFFSLGLLAKPMLVTLPFGLLLLDYWPLRRIRTGDEWAEGLGAQLRKPVAEKLPMIALAVAASAATFAAQRGVGAMGDLDYVSLGERVANAFAAYAIYIKQTFWPFDLAVFYPRHPSEALALWGIVGVLIVLGVTVAALLLLKTRPYVAVGWLWFLGTLVPVIGIVQVGQQSHADRYMYIPHIGLFLAAAWGIHELCARWPKWRVVAVTLAIVVLAGLAAVTQKQLGYWEDDETLFGHALAVTEENGVAHGSYGQALMRAGDAENAVGHLEAAARLRPGNHGDIHNLGTAHSRLGNVALAKEAFRAAIELDAGYESTRYMLGSILLEEGSDAEAIEQFTALLELNADHVSGRINRGIARARSGDVKGAEADFVGALSRDPDNPEGHYNFALALIQLGRPREAMDHLEQALRMSGDDAGMRGRVLALQEELKY